MNWEAIGAIAEGLGAIAVIMSVLYLAVQIRSQTRESRLAATRELASEFLDRTEHLFQDKELSNLNRVGIHDYMALADDDRVRVSLVWFNMVRVMEQQFLHTLHASIDARYLSSIKRSQKEFFDFPGVQTWWKLSTHSFDEDFRLHIDVLIEEAGATDFKSSFRPNDEQIVE